jgi:enterochelin esterase-like enzyme
MRSGSMRSRLALLALLLASAPAVAALHHHDGLASAHVPPRRVSVWVPDDRRPGERLPVIYLHDGQNLFEAATAYGGREWGLDEAVAGRAILVGVWNTPARWQEYAPQKVIERLPAELRARAPGPPQADAYLRYIVEELKPFIDRTYPTKPGRRTTFIMGSSMGGLISLYALGEYPRVFGRAAALSAHWPTARPDDIPPDALGRAWGDWAGTVRWRGRAYVDRGDQALDATYGPYAAVIEPALAAAGLKGTRCLFPGTGHDEAAWRARLDVPLAFLLAGTTPASAPGRTCGPLE